MTDTPASVPGTIVVPVRNIWRWLARMAPMRWAMAGGGEVRLGYCLR